MRAQENHLRIANPAMDARADHFHPHTRAAQADPSEARARQLQQDANHLFTLCLDAFDAFGVFERLPELAEDIRVLSLNAELAANRAGHRGAGVRVLTQYTRELVTRLTAAQNVMRQLRERVYIQSAGAATRIVCLRVMDRAVALVDHPTEPRAEGGARHIRQVRTDCLTEVVACLDTMVESVAELVKESSVVEDVTAQSSSIATNIAIEAASAGPYEAEFRQVAETMRRYMDSLKSLLTDGSQRVRLASEAGQAMHRKTVAWHGD